MLVSIFEDVHGAGGIPSVPVVPLAADPQGFPLRLSMQIEFRVFPNHNRMGECPLDAKSLPSTPEIPPAPSPAVVFVQNRRIAPQEREISARSAHPQEVPAEA
ncbi:hypothetical protein [Geobacter sp. DSM 9736]|uniref:hypothetical protein n=1 Tax=Geobacter sp. DSM 9736 TaxID=1277350 RepID=UPI000B5023F1|nr:hypothetical protein [Geobacter sp. DSM 9736]